MGFKNVIDEAKIFEILNSTSKPDKSQVLDVLDKAGKKKGLTLKDVGILVNTKNTDLIEKMFQCAANIKNDIYGERLVLFAPLYVSNYCINDCDYCGFHKRNPMARKKLSLNEVIQQTKILIEMGHKRLLLEFGEDPIENPIDYVVDVIKTIYKTKVGNGEIRRINVNISAATPEDYRKLKTAGIGTYQLFQETYHRGAYIKCHHGPKADYERQLFAHDKVFSAGIDDIGLGVLFGLYDWRFEVLALVSHSQYLDKKHDVGPHTISVPRFRPADTVDMELPHKVSEDELLRIIAILRMAVPYTGMIISTRETPQIRAKAFTIGISQTSAGSRTSPGGYGNGDRPGQFKLSDHRSVSEIIESILEQELLPSYCTACYRKGRTGHVFMDLAKPGDIHNLCRPNAILTFKEYIQDYASGRVKELGERIIKRYLDEICDENLRNETVRRLHKVEAGERDIFF